MHTLDKNLSDEQLMRHVQQGEAWALDALYHRYARRLLTFLYRMLGRDRDTAQDLLQDVFLKLIEKPHLFRSGYRFSTWIFTIAHNRCKNEYRRKATRRTVLTDADPDSSSAMPPDPVPVAEQHVDRVLFESALMTALEQLDASHRTTFLLRFQEEFSIQDIGEIMDCSPGTVKSRLFYTTRKLAETLKAFHPTNPKGFDHGKR